MDNVLFIDSQIWLGLYNSSPNNDLDEFHRLQSLLEDGKFKLVTTKQVIDEVRRNRYNAIYSDNKGSGNSILYHQNVSLNVPNFFKEFTEDIKKFNQGLKQVNDYSKKLNDEAREKVENNNLNADNLIKELLYKIDPNWIIDTDSFYDVAVHRMNIGNPPGKDNSYGDALNWEAVLGSNLGLVYMITSDKDYWNDKKRGVANDFLLQEWKRKKNTEIYFYQSLKDFFDQHASDKRNNNPREIAELIHELRQSPSYQATHEVVNKLLKFSGAFTEEDKKKLLIIAAFNSQVNDILGDTDVANFYSQLNNKPVTRDGVLSSLGQPGSVIDTAKLMDIYGSM